MSHKPTLAVVGATGTVGSVMLELLSIREDVWGEIRLIASPRTAGKRLICRDEELIVRAPDPGVFEGVEVALFDVPDGVSSALAPMVAQQGAVVVDNSSAFRMDPQVPLIVPQVNAGQVRRRTKGIIANPNSTTLTMMDVIGALHRRWGLTELVVSSYQSASGAGQAGVDRLYDELQVVAGNRTLGRTAGDVRRQIAAQLGEKTPFDAPLALNVVPWAGARHEEGWSTEELKVRNESRKILGLPGLKVSATCVRVPVVAGHSLAIHAVFQDRVDVEEARQTLIEAPGVVLLDDPDAREFPTPVDVAGSDPTFVGRLRQSGDFPNALDMFVCGDNLRKGAALNTIEIAELVAAELSS